MKTDSLSAENIKKYLSEACSDFDIQVLPVTASTNTVARDEAENGAPEGSVVIANRQTSGRGRRGRDFYSPDDTGLYMSIVLRPKGCPADKAATITTIAAVAVCEAIEAVSGKTAQIKWVNDVFVAGRKVCGILTEASFDSKGMLEFAVLGIGINLSVPEGGFPQEIKDIAGAVFEEDEIVEKSRIAAEVINRFMERYKIFGDGNYIAEYRKRCFVIGREIKVMSQTGEKKATALDVNEACHLIVKLEDGTVEALSSGEISVRTQ